MQSSKKLWILITVASLGYFVDIYDLILYNVIKHESLQDLGIPLSKETVLFNFQMIGMLLGGILWGIWGDKRGRVSVLFGSIILYSIANICNAFVSSLESYAFWRFIAGLGLAGELGAAITLVTENMKTEKRGYGTMIVVTFGALGAVAAYFVARMGKELFGGFLNQFVNMELQNWQISYIIGGLLGVVLLILRSSSLESKLFTQVKESSVAKGNFKILFANRTILKKYVACIAIGVPVWYVVGVLIALSHRILLQTDGSAWDAKFTGTLVLWSYIGLSIGDFISGLLSQWLKSRKKVIFIYLAAIAVSSLFYFTHTSNSITFFSSLALILGAATGYWALFVTNASEQFGTNIRSTVTATVPNFVRGSVVPLYLLFDLISAWYSPIIAAVVLGIISLAVAFWGTSVIEESFSKNLDYTE